MELWQLRTFRTVARTLHFTRASEELNLSQPAVSHQIKALEKEVSEPLFVRGREGISLTPAGKVMLEHADRILSIAEQIKLQIEDSKVDPRGRIRFAALSRGLRHNFPEVFLGFREKFPDIELEYQTLTDTKSLRDGVSEGVIDIGLMAVEPDKQVFDSIP